MASWKPAAAAAADISVLLQHPVDANTAASFKMTLVKLTLLTSRTGHESRTSESKTQRRDGRRTHCRPSEVGPQQELNCEPQCTAN